MKWDQATYRITDPGRTGKVALAVALFGAAGSIIAVAVDSRQFFHSWLVAYVFWFSLGAGSLFFVMLHHLVGATWSVVVRRLAENVMAVFPLMAAAFVPLVFGLHDLYHWSHEEAAAGDRLLQWKSPYLNVSFFLVRTAMYFAVWIVLARLLYAASIRQDGGHGDAIASRFRKVSAPGMILFAFTVTLAAFDWLMSLDAHWYSTVFGLYVFAGCLVCFLAFLPLTAIYLNRRQALSATITVEHYHDMGKLLFAFIIFWAYMAFSQYFLIWYGNIPEETQWFLHRWDGSWRTASLCLVMGHFVLPFFILITRGAKRNPKILGTFAVWILVMHWLDIYWLVMPGLHPHGIHFTWVDLTTMMTIGGAVVAAFWRLTASRPVVPVGDPKLDTSTRLVS